MTPPDTVSYAVAYEAKRSRLTTFFRYFMAIPHFVVLFFYAIAGLFAVIAAWFAIVITAKYPAGIYGFVAGLQRYTARVSGYLYLLTDVYPPFNGSEDPAYPIQLAIGPPKEQYSRLLAFFRAILLIPVYIVTYLLGIAAMVIAFLSWLVIIVTGKQPEGLQSAQVFCLGYTARAGVYGSLLTEKFPPFDNEADGPAVPTAPIPGGLQG